MKEARSLRRYLKRHGDSNDLGTEYQDVAGNIYTNKVAAGLSSFGQLVIGCIKNGFPIVLRFMVYNAWAFYPFFFIRRNTKVESANTILNHERIHIHQQRDLHVLVSLPLLVVLLCLYYFGYDVLSFIPMLIFVPTIFYGIDVVRAFFQIRGKYDGKITWNVIRENTCFEREAISHCTNLEYLKDRKFLSVLKYL